MDGIAGSTTVNYTPDNLIAGSDPIFTDNGTLSSGQNLVRGTPVGRVTASGELVECNPGAADGSQTPIGILVHDIDASAAAKGCQFYKAGRFRASEMTWHAGFTTDVQKRAAFDRTPITIVV